MPRETKITKTNIKELFKESGLVYEEKDGRNTAIIAGKEVDILFGEDGAACTGEGPLIKVIMDYRRKLDSVFCDEKGTSIGKRFLKRYPDTELEKAKMIIDKIIDEREENRRRDEEMKKRKGELDRLKAISDAMSDERVKSKEEVLTRMGELEKAISKLKGRKEIPKKTPSEKN